MDKLENRVFVEKLQIALTIVIGNDVIIPSIEQREAVFENSFVHAYIWRYKKCGIKVDLRTIVNADILKNNVLCDCVENTRAYVKRELCRMLDKEVKSNAM